MSQMAQLDQLLQELIEAEQKTDEYATVIGNVEHIHSEYEPADYIEDAYITALVQAEILAENIVDILHPMPFGDDDKFWNAVVNVRLYIQNTDVNELTLEGIDAAMRKAI